MIFWMTVITGAIFSINAALDIPDEITGPVFFFINWNDDFFNNQLL